MNYLKRRKLVRRVWNELDGFANPLDRMVRRGASRELNVRARNDGNRGLRGCHAIWRATSAIAADTRSQISSTSLSLITVESAIRPRGAMKIP
jgi:hypothetical protein